MVFTGNYVHTSLPCACLVISVRKVVLATLTCFTDYAFLTVSSIHFSIVDARVVICKTHLAEISARRT